MSEKSSSKKMPRYEKWLFASGDMYGGGAQIIISFYYLIFLTDVVGIRPALAGAIVLVSKIWDAVSDPLMGVITDNTRTKHGRRKPYFLAGFLGIIIAFFLLWYPVGFDSQIGKFIFVLFSYLFYSTIQTMVMVPYAAMSSEISVDFDERTSVNGLRLFLSQFSTMLCAVLPIEIVKMMPDVKSGYITMAIIFGVFFALPYILMFFYTKERVPYKRDDKSRFNYTTFIEPFKVKSFRYLLGIYMSSFLAMDIVSAVFAYYMNYYLERPPELNYVLGFMLLFQTIMVPVIVRIAKAIGKANTVKVSLVVWLVGVFFLAFQTAQSAWWTIYAVAGIMGIGIGGCVVMAWTMYPDVTDVGEFAFKRRNAGSFGGIMTFMRKFSAAIGIFIVSQILDLAGYVQPLQKVVDGATVNILQEQSAAVITAIKIIAVFFPVVLIGLTYLFAKKYPLTHKIYERLSIQIKFERGEKEEGLDRKEIKELEETLI
ncbi:MAG TPA: MFS transporter [Halanaerobiales bacterium]|nr:MFS transporter [Halanaerobiales bacterium]